MAEHSHSRRPATLGTHRKSISKMTIQRSLCIFSSSNTGHCGQGGIIKLAYQFVMCCDDQTLSSVVQLVLELNPKLSDLSQQQAFKFKVISSFNYIIIALKVRGGGGGCPSQCQNAVGSIFVAFFSSSPSV
jgi:hypothetical protein